MTATVPMGNEVVQGELTRYMEDQWDAVIGKDVDGPGSLPVRLDRENSNLGRYSSCRRVARAICIGSAPTSGAAIPGIDEKNVLLGCVQPGEQVPTFGDALRRLTDGATFLYVDGRWYWYSTQPSVTRLAQDRAGEYDEDEVWEKIKELLRADKGRGDFARVHVAPESSAEVPDEMEARLVVLGPEHPHAVRNPASEARATAAEILGQRGSNPRLYKNTLLFLAPDRQRLKDLEARVRQYMAWSSIKRDREALNLTPMAESQADTKRTEEVERQISAALTLEPEPLIKQAQVRDYKTHGYLREECLVYMMREYLGRGEKRVVKELSEILVRRCAKSVNKKLQALGPQEVEDAFNAVFEKLFDQVRDLDSDRGDFLQIRFWVVLGQLAASTV